MLAICFSANGQEHEFRIEPLKFEPVYSPEAEVLFLDAPNYLRIKPNKGMSITDTIVTGASSACVNGLLILTPFDETVVTVELHAVDSMTGRIAKDIKVFQTVDLPFVTINDVKADSMMSSLECLLAKRLHPDIEGYFLPMKVDSFKMETVQAGELISLNATGDVLSKEMRQVIYDVDQSIEVLFYDVWGSYGTSQPIRFQNYRVYITEDDPNPTSIGIGLIRRD